jgi:NADH dehydrogenase
MDAADSRPHVVIVGGGFGGLYAAKQLRRAPVRLTLIDRRNHHLFQPLLYQVATAGLNPSDIAAPIRRVLRKQKNAFVLLDEVTAVDVAHKRVLLASDRAISYDFLIFAIGATHSYFGHNEWEPLAPGLKSIEDALEIRKRALLAFEVAEKEPDPERRAQWLTFVIVGGGPTGVEMAGALVELARHTVAGDFRSMDPRKSRVLLLEGGDRVLPTYPPALSAKAEKQLVKLGVEVRTKALVTGIDAEGVTVGNEHIPARTVIWAAGVAASPLARSLGAPLDRQGRIRVRPDLTLPGDDDVFVVGDLAALEQDGKPVPGVAPAAMQEGRYAAMNIRRRLQGKRSPPFRYRDKGSLATIGRGAGVADFGRFTFSGFFAWLAWLLVHIFFLIGFRNRVLVILEWAWAYVTYDRGARLITGAGAHEISAVPPRPPEEKSSKQPA